jgi:RNA polymerase sigma-70 factor (ECF subfamily)
MRFVAINGQPGAVLLGHDGRPFVVIALDIADEQVQAVRAISNPEKLRHLASAGERPDGAAG